LERFVHAMLLVHHLAVELLPGAEAASASEIGDNSDGAADADGGEAEGKEEVEGEGKEEEDEGEGAGGGQDEEDKDEDEDEGEDGDGDGCNAEDVDVEQPLALLPLCHRPQPCLAGAGCSVVHLPSGDVAIVAPSAMEPGACSTLMDRLGDALHV
jgi:hypothetical protein